VTTGDNIGNMESVDLRIGKFLGSYKGSSGAIRSLEYHSVLPRIASCGLDRFLRIHHSENRTLLHKCYLKQKLQFLLLSKEVEQRPSRDKFQDSSMPGENNSDNEWIEEENMWDSMETVYNPETGRKRKGRSNYRKIKDVSQRQ